MVNNMSKRDLQEILDRENFMREYYKLIHYEIHTLTQSQVDKIVESIDCSLSPENLHCDGEISHSQAQAKYRKLTGALHELKRMGFDVNSDEYPMR